MPDDGNVYRLEGNPGPVPLPPDVWLEVNFSTPEAGWVIEGPAEKGITQDTFALWETDTTTWGCYYWFGGAPWAGFVASIACASSRGEAPAPFRNEITSAASAGMPLVVDAVARDAEVPEGRLWQPLQ